MDVTKIDEMVRAVGSKPILSAGTKHVEEKDDTLTGGHNEVADWMQSLGLGKYAAAMKEHDYDDLQLIKNLSDEQLDTMITIIGFNSKETETIKNSLFEHKLRAEEGTDLQENEIAKINTTQEEKQGLRDLEAECHQLELQMKDAIIKGNIKRAEDLQLKLDVKNHDLVTTRKRLAAKSKVSLETLEREMHALIQEMMAAARSDNFQLVPDLQVKIVLKKQELEIAKRKSLELKFTVMMLLEYQGQMKDVGTPPMEDDDAREKPLRHQQLQPQCDTIPPSAKPSVVDDIQEGSIVQFTIFGKQLTGTVCAINTTREFPHEVRVGPKVHTMHLDAGTMRMSDSYGNKVPFEFVKQKTKQKEQEEKIVPKKIHPQNITQVGTETVNNKITSLSLKGAKKPRFKTVVCVVEDPNNIDNVTSIIDHLDIIGVENLYIVDSLKIMPDDLDTLTKDNSTPKRVNIHIFKTTTDCIAELSKSNYVSVATSPLELGKKNLYLSKGTYTQSHLAVWLGNETKGLSDEALQCSEFCVQIEISGIVDSLNLAVAAGLVFCAVIRQRLPVNRVNDKPK